MPRGEWASPDEERYIAAIEDAASPTKQLELVEKRSTWVFGAVGTVGTALTGFTLLAGSRSLIDVYPVIGVFVVILTLVAIALAASTLMIRQKTLNTSDIDAIERYFDRLVPSRATRATLSVAILVAAIVLAGVGGLVAFLSRDPSHVALEWQTGADGPTLSLAVAIGDVDPGATLEVSLTAIAGEESDELYSASATADSSGSVSLEADVPVPSEASRANLVVTNAADDREVARTSVPIPAT